MALCFYAAIRNPNQVGMDVRVLRAGTVRSAKTEAKRYLKAGGFAVIMDGHPEFHANSPGGVKELGKVELN